MGYEAIALLVITASLLLVFAVRPALTRERGGRILAFVGLFVLPALTFTVGVGAHVERSKRTEFCLSCHIMEPYGRSLRIDDEEYVPAGHFQNARVDREEACFTCHTTYALYGDLKAKIGGLRHLAANYLSAPPDTIRLYQPFHNRECLHCHSGARSFEESDTHTETDTTLAAIRANRVSCMSSGCHDLVHDVHGLDKLPLWKGHEP